MMDSEDISDNQGSICIHCCGPVRQSNKAHHSSHSLSNSTDFVMTALSSIFKLNYLKPFESLDWHQKESEDEQFLCLCSSCNAVLTSLYHLYEDFLQLGQVDSFLSKTLDRLDKIIDCHEQKSINCDLITITETEAKKDVRDKFPTTAIGHRQLCPNELSILLTRLPENEFTSKKITATTSLQQEEDEIEDNSTSDQDNDDDDDDDYDPGWSQVKMEEDDYDERQTPGIKVKDLEYLVESEDDVDEQPLNTFSRSSKRKQDLRSSRMIESSTTTTIKNRSNQIPKTNNKTSNRNHKKCLGEKKKLQYLSLKGKFANPCWYCERTDFVTPADCLEHTMEEHFPKINNSAEKPSVCTRCSKICVRPRDLPIHLMWCETIPFGTASKQFQCTICSKTFARKDGLKEHMVCHSEDRNFSCDQCSYKAKTTKILSVHKLYKHSSNKDGMKCDQCGSSCKNDLVLRMHKKNMHTVEGYKKYREKARISLAKEREKTKVKVQTTRYTTCVDCDVDFFNRLALANHRRTVHGVSHGEFTCDACGRNLISKHALEFHIKTVHSDDRPYICEQCGRSFKRCGNLKSHVEQTHTEEGRLKYNELSREKNRRKKLRESQLAGKVAQSGQIGGDSSNSNE